MYNEDIDPYPKLGVSQPGKLKNSNSHKIEEDFRAGDLAISLG